MGVDMRSLPVRCGVFGAEPWSEALRHDLEARFGISAVDVYGLSEILGPGVACECSAGQNGLHAWEDHFLFEVIDPKTLRRLPMGTPGELVITTLTKEALPMIRYRTRDITRLTDEPCVCGRTHARIMRVTGRDDDMIIIRGVNVFPSQIEALLVGFPDLAPHYQIELTHEGPLDAITVEVELVVGAPSDELSHQESRRDPPSPQIDDRRDLQRPRPKIRCRAAFRGQGCACQGSPQNNALTATQTSHRKTPCRASGECPFCDPTRRSPWSGWGPTRIPKASEFARQARLRH